MSKVVRRQYEKQLKREKKARLKALGKPYAKLQALRNSANGIAI